MPVKGLTYLQLILTLLCGGATWAPLIQAAPADLRLVQAQFSRDALQVKGRLRAAASGAVDIYDLDGQPLGSAPLTGKRFKLKLSRAALRVLPCGIVAQYHGQQVALAVRRAPGACAGLAIRKAEWSDGQGVLNVAVKGQSLSLAPLDLYDLDANLLASEAPQKSGRFAFNLERAKLKAGVPCAVRVTNGAQTAAAPVRKAPAGCTVLPLPTRCAIAEPASGSRLGAHQPVNFRATVETPDPAALPVKVEWDFAGGVMGHPSAVLDAPGDHQTRATFVRDNSTYRVRFAATDAKGQRCEAAIDVAVGAPPTGLPPKVPEQPAPPIGGKLGGLPGDLVVLPFEDLTMLSQTDALLKPNLLAMLFPYRSLNAQVYRKGRLPERLGSEQVELTYSAASNPADAAGAGSINSTSQNWPVGAALLEASLQKSDMFELNLESGEATPSFMNSFGFDEELGPGVPDQGFQVTPAPPLQQKRGNFMPGIASPYLANDPQPFDAYNPAQTWFVAQLLPTTDVDDAGRINPYPLFRIEAKAPGGGVAQAVTDSVLTSGRDLHCRECHEKGGIAADPNVQMQVRFYEQSNHAIAHHASPHGDQPTFYAPVNDRLDERERAAYLNIASLHDFYDGIGTLSHALGGVVHDHVGAPGPNQDSACYLCHSPWQELAKGLGAGFDAVHGQINRHTYANDPTRVGAMYDSKVREGGRTGIVGYDFSSAIHTFHGELMYNADKSGIRRWPNGRFERWHPEDGPNPAPLFPVKDVQGNPLPMEENCLKCHGGQREQHYRDRMFTAGVTCYQCHGDMLAVGGFYKQSQPSEDGRDRRAPWFDQPDCGGCHVGSGNLGGSGKPGFFSAGVRTTAFDKTDPSAKPRSPTEGADGARFAVPSTIRPISYGADEVEQTAAGLTAMFRGGGLSMRNLLYRLAKDTHGNVSCAACHGAAHAIWPNRDPNANDNVTAMQLQGHTGHILECRVCHTADAFLKKENLDGGPYMGVPAGVLGGPHNLHPVNDPNWWKEATGQPNGKAGWHDDYAKQAGTAGEDQCAACHGNDHRGTRLAKTPVARAFVDENGKKVLVKAGAEIGCDLCHSIEKSCEKSPNPSCGTSEGYVGPTNRPPVFTSVPVTQVIKGELYHAQAAASDPDGDAVTVKLSYNPTPEGDPNAATSGTLKLDATARNLTGDWATKEFVPNQGVWNYVLTASDGRGGTANQIVTVKMACPPGLLLEQADCVKLRVTSEPPVSGLDAGQTFTYPIQVMHGDGLPVTFSLAEGAPEGVTIGANGVLTWTATGFSEEGSFSVEVVATDPNGIEARQYINLTICVGSQHWNEAKGCVGPITFTSTPPAGNSGYYGLNVGEKMVYHVSASHAQGLPVHFSLADAPASMTIDANSGHLEWTADVEAAAVGNFSLSIVASDSQGGLSRQYINLTVCAPPTRWDAQQGSCVE